MVSEAWCDVNCEIWIQMALVSWGRGQGGLGLLGVAGCMVWGMSVRFDSRDIGMGDVVREDRDPVWGRGRGGLDY